MATVETLKRTPVVFEELPGKRQKSFGDSSSEEDGDEDYRPSEPKAEESKGTVQNKSVDLEKLFPPKLVIPPKSETWGQMDPIVPQFLTGGKSQNIHIQTPVDLAVSPNILPLHSIFGLQEMKDILLTRVAVPLASPERFSFFKNPGNPLQTNFFLFGRHGTGKRSLIRSFCQDRGITLCEAFAPGFLPLEELFPLYEAAYKNAPSIVLLNDCDAIFMKNSPNVAPLWRILKDIRERGLPVWTIFRSQFKQDILDNILQDQLSYSIWAGVPSPLDRERLWYSTATLQCRTNPTQSPGTEDALRV
jgi:hypothetical protein